MKLYRFSPIESIQACHEALEYIHTELRKLSNQLLDERLPINTLKIFAHYDPEYNFLERWVTSVGQPDEESSSTSLYVRPSTPLALNGETIVYVGIRVPDPYRAQVGCGDFVVPNFDAFIEKYLGRSPFIRKVQHPRYEMLELFHPDVDVLGYIVKDD